MSSFTYAILNRTLRRMPSVFHTLVIRDAPGTTGRTHCGLDVYSPGGDIMRFGTPDDRYFRKCGNCSRSAS
jgi:hypothetical protein